MQLRGISFLDGGRALRNVAWKEGAACVCVCAQVKYALLHVVAFVKLCISRSLARSRQTKQRPFLGRENLEQGVGGVGVGGAVLPRCLLSKVQPSEFLEPNRRRQTRAA